jgi:hypothetical protein
MEAHLQFLTQPAHRPVLAQVTLALGSLLAAHGHALSLPQVHRAEGEIINPHKIHTSSLRIAIAN